MVHWYQCNVAHGSHGSEAALPLSRLLFAACVMWVAGKFARIGHAVICSAYNLCVSPTDSSDYQLSADSALGEFCRVAAPFVVIAVLSQLSNGRTRDE